MVGSRAGKILIALVAAVVTAAASVAPPAARVAADIPHTDLPIRLIAGDIDPAVVGTLTTTEASTPGRYIVQFDRPVSSADRAALEEGGARVRGYLPEFAFAVRVDEGTAIPDVPGVRAIIAFEPSWRLSPRLTDGFQTVRIIIDPDVDVDTVLPHLADAGFSVLRVGSSSVVATIDGAVDLATVAHRGIAWVEPFDARVKHNEESGTIIGIGGAHASGYDGSTQIVAVADTGLGDAQEDGDTTDGEYGGTDPHPDIPASRIVEVLDYSEADILFCQDVIPDGAQDVDSGHGTHVTGSVLFDPNTLTRGEVGEGTAPGARLVFQAVEEYVVLLTLCDSAPDGYYLVGIPLDVGDLFQDAYDLGARIHSNSWGSSVFGEYTQTSADADSFMWDNPDMLVVTSAGNSGTDVADSNGIVDNDSIGAPATAKNLLTVGASEGARTDDFPCDNTQSYVNVNTGLSCQTQVSGSGLNDIFTYGDAWPTDYPPLPWRRMNPPVTPSKWPPSPVADRPMMSVSSRTSSHRAPGSCRDTRICIKRDTASRRTRRLEPSNTTGGDSPTPRITSTWAAPRCPLP